MNFKEVSKRPRAKLDAYNRVYIPAYVLKKLGLQKEGQEFEVKADEDNKAILIQAIK